MSPTPDESLADLIESGELEAAARRRAFGLHDDEQRKRRQLKRELIEELRRPLVERHGPSDLEAIAAQRKPRPAR